MIDTKKVADRRQLHFDALQEAIRDAEAIAAAEAERRLRATGNWTPGQAISHVAFWANAPFDGYPDTVKPPWLMRMAMRVIRGRVFTKGMPPGMRLPGAPGGTLGAESMPADEAAAKLRAAFERLDEHCPEIVNPLFGPMTHTQWRQLNLRHAELHFSFFHPE